MRTITFLLIFLFSCQSNSDKLKTIEPIVEKIQSQFKEGDIIFHKSNSNQSEIIQSLTASPYSHMGILFQEQNEWVVYEAVQPVKITPLQEWINRGVDHHYVLKRVDESIIKLNKEDILAMKNYLNQQIDKDYDSQFLWSDEKMYCSELVWKVYHEVIGIELGELQRFQDFNLSTPEVQAIINQRFNKEFPYQETVITPQQIFSAELLVSIQSTY